MDTLKTRMSQYDALVTEKFYRYNEIFLTLPFPGLLQSGTALPRFSDYALKKLLKKETPKQIVEGFFKTILKIEDPKSIRKIQILFLQFVERQIVLFDALEDSAFAQTHDLQGPGSFDDVRKKATDTHQSEKMKEILKTYRTRLVLTAHPTQFYPIYVIHIIHKLSKQLGNNDLNKIEETLLQLGKTSLTNARAPTPLDEGDFLLMQMRESIYPALKSIQSASIELGFWPGGDRDGNPKVNTQTTIEASKRLKNQIIHLYQKEVDNLRSYLTFPDVWEPLTHISLRLKITRQAIRSAHNLNGEPYHHAEEFVHDLLSLKNTLSTEHNNLFASRLDTVIGLAQQFGFHFASLDIRQNSDFHGFVIHTILNEFDSTLNYQALSEEKKTATLFQWLNRPGKIDLKKIQDESILDTLHCFKSILKIQRDNGPMGLQRYIISHTECARHIFEIFLLAKWAGLKWQSLPLDIVPLFESIEDLNNSAHIMKILWENPIYKKHLKKRGSRQTVMLGFSDGTKDGGYVTANWSIYKSKLMLNQLATQYKIDLIFFDGRGGPPSRGGGNTHLFYRALEKATPQSQVQLTIQGQTISSDFGTPDSAKFNIEQLMTAALSEKLFPSTEKALDKKDLALIQKISDISATAYHQLKKHPLFLSYLSQVTPLDYYGKLSIASRPPRRKKSLSFSDLRAIPFVGAWSQMKQNVPGYFGLGTALHQLIEEGHLKALQTLYRKHLYFSTLLNNAMMSLRKSNFLVTEYLRKDPKFGKFWTLLYDEAALTSYTCLLVSKQNKLMDNEPLLEKSISTRENIVFPLLILQQYALDELRTSRKTLSKDQVLFLERLILKSLAANINAARNAV